MLNKAPGIHCHKPEGAFYVYPSIQGCIGKTSAAAGRSTTDEDFVLALLDEDGRRRGARRGVLLSRAISASATPTRRRSCGEACTRIQHFCQGLH